MAKQPVEGRPADVSGDIDQRMAALLKDHQEMGARPAEEPVSTDAPDPATKTTKKATAKK